MNRSKDDGECKKKVAIRARYHPAGPSVFSIGFLSRSHALHGNVAWMRRIQFNSLRLCSSVYVT
jgi:hypothetical protein